MRLFKKKDDKPSWKTVLYKVFTSKLFLDLVSDIYSSVKRKLSGKNSKSDQGTNDDKNNENGPDENRKG